ncbi:hypothetical protein D3C87_295710 [compost metagenome]
MKNYTKLMASAAAAIAIFVSTNVNAQTASEPTNPSRQKFGIGLNVGAGTSDGLGLAIGGDLRYQFDIDRQLSVPISAGYTNFSVKDNYGGGSFGYIPVKAGLKYFFSDTGSGAYGMAEAGAGFGTKNGTGTAFVYAPTIGYAWSSGFDLGAKYEGYSNNGNIGYAGIRLAYGFKL